MSQVYSEPSRANDPNALPDVETFYAKMGDWYYDLSSGETCDDSAEHATPNPSGWYWHSCFPGCLPDGPPIGPFDTEEEAKRNAQGEWS